jgi:hypothetical protein
MARSATPATVSKTPPINEAVIAAESSAANQLAVMTFDAQEKVTALAHALGYDGALSVGALEDGIRFYQQRTAEACLQLGLRLRLLKEACLHGDFKPRLDLLGIEVRFAQRVMAVAEKFSKASTSPLLKAANSQSKLIELLVLDDSEILELDAGGTVLGVNLDDIDRMGVREMRSKLREARKENVAAQERISVKDAQIDQMKQRIQLVKPDEVLPELHKETIEHMNAARCSIKGQLRKAFVDVGIHHEVNGGDSILFMAGIVGQLKAELVALCEEFDLPDVSNAADAQLVAEMAEWNKPD